MHEEQIGRFPSHLTFFRRQVLHAYTGIKYVHDDDHSTVLTLAGRRFATREDRGSSMPPRKQERHAG